ncbi:30S ribosomal protein S17 [Candidatus Peregrinibacteria bacterium]|nr:30S ribosomal protein S17 [Candidatus Peregrinibacteria bacterium]
MRTKTGIVVSNKMKNTVVVRVEFKKAHQKYKKLMRVSKKFYADDPENKYKEGDSITIYETRPLSKLKRWTVTEPTKSSE